MNNWEFFPAIEDMPEEKLASRIREIMEQPIDPAIITIPYVAGIEEIVEYACAELTAKCPMTGLRDFYEITIRFQPDKLLPELKSLRRYFHGYDELPISHEHLAAKIYNDFKATVNPAKFHLKLDTAIRGGIRTVVRLGDEI